MAVLSLSLGPTLPVYTLDTATGVLTAQLLIDISQQVSSVTVYVEQKLVRSKGKVIPNLTDTKFQRYQCLTVVIHFPTETLLKRWLNNSFSTS